MREKLGKWVKSAGWRETLRPNKVANRMHERAKDVPGHYPRKGKMGGGGRRRKDLLVGAHPGINMDIPWGTSPSFRFWEHSMEH